MRHISPTIVAVLFALAISTLPYTSTHAAPSVIVVSGNISVSTTWTSGNIYYVTSDTTVVAGVTLRIEPGVIVKFRSNSGLIIDGKLEAMGTASQPIYFTSYRDDSAGGDTDGGGSSSGAKGDWNWIQFNAISDDASLIEYAVIRYGGGKSSFSYRGVYGNVYLRDASPTIRHSTLEHSEGAGVYLESTAAGSSAPVISNNRFSNNASSISTDVTSRPTLTNNTSSANSTNGLLVRGGTINSNTNWDQLDMVYRVAGDITVASGATLTVAPGMIIKFNSNVTLFVDGKLEAMGTASQPIYFTSYRDDSAGGDTDGGGSSSGAKGDWNWIQFNAISDDASLIEYAVIRYGGGKSSFSYRGVYGNVYLRDASPTIRHSTLEHSEGAGVYLESTAAGSSAPVISNNRFSNNASSISTDVTSRPTLTNNTSSANSTNGLLVRGGTINSNTNWDQLDMVYRVAGDITVASGATLTIAPGMIIKFNSNVTLFVDGKLEAMGTANQPIYFTSYRDDSVGGDTNGDSSSGAKGDWNWIQFNAISDDTSLIEHAVIRYGGGKSSFSYRGVYGNVYLRDASPTIRHSTLAHSEGAGVYLESTAAGSSAPVISNNRFSNNNSSINTDVTSRPTLTNNSSSANGTNGLLVRGGTINSNTNWDQLDMVYRVAGDITVASGATLTIAPGMIIKFNSNVTLFVDGKLEAMGTANQPIYFTSYRDDSVGGDTDGGGSSSGAKGDWNWIQFNAISDDTSLIEHAVIRYGGGKSSFSYRGVYGNVYLRDASPTIRHSTLAHSEGAGIYAQNATPTLICNDIMNNAALGIRNASPDTIISAINQYWGDPSGPKHATLNPNGRGNGVSDGVTFVPWQTTPCWMPLSGSSSLFIPLVVR
ncbi:right-handed parallel beta-helix repeat-containing protein [Chloroflexus sp. Y-396-1]|uniref:right-handed parallel beta-helix repeat-containing protein n=1 Tax=Chloroflexus sp. Y-396-1 TaxID=867845 RepID=UPI00048CFED5|nr:right-handed parallel beta-helix repeat-containing protein [Chloroflexus sp. Y-396-1]